MATDRPLLTLCRLRSVSLGLMAASVLGGCATSESSVPLQLDVDSLPAVRDMDPRFQSFQIGMSHLTGGETWKAYGDAGSSAQAESFDAVRETRQPTDLGNPRLRTLAAALGPFYVRYGGTTTNSVYFQNDDQPRLTRAPDGFQAVLTRQAWKGAVDFAKAVDAEIITGFTASEGVRDASGAWTPSMADAWWGYTRAIGGQIAAAELFNEPNAPEPGHREQAVSASDYARDLARFRAAARQAAPQMRVAGPGVALMGGPEAMARLQDVTAEQYMSAAPTPRVDIVSYHFYGALAERCAPPGSAVGIDATQALDEAWLARPDAAFARIKALRDAHAPGAPIWLTETGAAACGGTRWQPTFLDSFRYLDAQARLARQGLDAHVTHALISGSNGIIDEKTFEPNASYWAALLWRRLIGTRVLDTGTQHVGLHLYAHCRRGTPGEVTVLALNLGATSRTLQLPSAPQVYSLTAQPLQSRTVLLNGQPLRMVSDTVLPAIEPVQSNSPQVELAPHSVSFMTVPAAGNSACSG